MLLRNVTMLVFLGVRRTGSLLLKEKQGIANRAFFENLLVHIILDIRNSFLDLEKSWHDFTQPQEETFQSSRSVKSWRHLIMLQKYFLLKIPKVHTLPNCRGNQFRKVSWTISEFGTDIADMYGHVARSFKVFEWLSSAKQEVKKSKEVRKCTFVYFFNLLESHLVLIFTKTSTFIEHYLTCINALINFCNVL